MFQVDGYPAQMKIVETSLKIMAFLLCPLFVRRYALRGPFNDSITRVSPSCSCSGWRCRDVVRAIRKCTLYLKGARDTCRRFFAVGRREACAR